MQRALPMTVEKQEGMSGIITCRTIVVAKQKKEVDLVDK